jgi:hypothetical protein
MNPRVSAFSDYTSYRTQIQNRKEIKSLKNIKITTSIWIRIGTGFNQVSGSGSRRAKSTHKNRKKFRNSCFEVLDVLF